MSTPSEFSGTDFVREVAALRRTFARLIARLNQPVGESDFTIPQWCRKHNISRAGFYKMRSAGRGPEVIVNGGLVRITPEADRAWTARYTSTVNDEGAAT
jgi:hypothetical protein